MVMNPKVESKDSPTKTDPSTPPKTNMEPTNEGLEDVSPFQMGDFQVPC